MRGFSLVEAVLAFALASIALTAALVATLGLPVAAHNLDLKAGAISMTRSLLDEALTTGSKRQATSDAYSSSVRLTEGEDVGIAVVHAVATWKNALGIMQSVDLAAKVAGDDITNPCDDFIEHDWHHPVVKISYELQSGLALPAREPPGAYDVAALSASSSTVVVAIGSSSSSVAPTLLFFTAHGTDPTLAYDSGFDNASTSRIGFSSVAVAEGYAFAGNGFGSKSGQTCSDGMSCAQVHIFSLPPNARRLASLQLSTSTPPSAITSSGTTAAVASLFYYRGYLYVGLEKTESGDEFNILDVRDPLRPSWQSGIHIGRTVSSIIVRGDKAYVSTDDSTGELVVVDVTDPVHPAKLGIYDAPGAAGFGYGAAVRVRGGTARFGRSYSPDGSEFEILDVHDPMHITSIQGNDIGTSKNPASLKSMESMDTLTFALFTNQLLLIDMYDFQGQRAYSEAYALPKGSVGASLTCRDNLLYLARNTGSGGIIDVLAGS